MKKKLYEDLCRICGTDGVKREEPMSRHITFRVGGPADYYVEPHTKEELTALLCALKREEEPYFIIGNGSNLLVGDRGIRGTVIQIGKNISHIETDGTEVTAEAGVLLSSLAREVMKCGLSGFEFASGIPGTLGGAITMNAGAYGGEIAHVIEHVLVVDGEGKQRILSAEEMAFGYRESAVRTEGYVVLEASFRFQRKDPARIKAYMEELNEKRREKQPLEYPSAGSTFKRPKGEFAGKLIMESGLSGFRVGGAEVSRKHCGFVINTGNATAQDILELIRQVQKKVKEKTGILLEPEVKMLGEF